MELCAQLPALNVKENIYSLFHVACPVLQRNCKHISSSFGRVGWGKGEGGGGEEYTKTRKGLKRSTLIKDTDPLFRDLEDNQIEELPPGVFENKTELAVL